MRYLFGNYVLAMQCYELHGAGGPIKLRRKVFQVLVYLLAHRHRVVSKQELFTHVWPDQFVGEGTLTSCITALRKALGDDGRTPRFLRTLHGQGYRFVAAVEVQEPLPAGTASHALTLPGERERVSGDEAGTHAVLSPPFQPLPEGALVLHEAPLPLAMPLNVEHKQVTALCGALAEAPALAARLGPEAMYHLMHDVLTLAQETMQRYGGTILQVSGEGFLALFGAPVAQEDHARRAVLAALDLRQRLRVPEALQGQPHGVALRLGLHTGPVVVGPLEYDPQRPYTAVGGTLALAIRLQQQAAPDTVLVSAATYALVQAEVQGEVWTAGPHTASPASEAGYVVHGLLRRRAGVPQRSARPLSRFVGRARELALLHERLEQALSGPGQAVGLIGEPGIGKSRLLAEFAHSLNGQSVMYCEGHCLAYGSTTPYLPVRDLLQQLWGLPDAAPTTAITATVYQRLREALLLLQLLDVPVDLAPLAALSPPERKARTFALLRHLIRRASQQPLLLALENLHWIDPTSEEWLASLEQALQALAHLPEDGDTRALAIELRLALGVQLSVLREHEQGLALLGEAETLARALDDRTRLVQVLARMAQILRLTREHDGAIAAGRQALELAIALGESALQVRAAHHLGQAYYAIGDFGRAAELLRWSVEAADRVSDTRSPDVRIQSRAWLARTLSAIGAFAEGRRHGEEALRLAILEGRGSTPIVVHGCLGHLYLAEGDLEHAIRAFDQGLALCRTSGSRDWLPGIATGLGYAYASQGRLAEGYTLLEEVISKSIRAGALPSHVYTSLSEVCRLAGRGDEAWQHVRQALDLAQQQQARGNEAQALHQLGTVHAHTAPPNVAQAEAYYRQALALAEELGMRPLQAHCHLGLGALYATTGRHEQARTALAAAIALYGAMDMVFWLPQAEAALAQIE